jgi:hypothetical protein
VECGYRHLAVLLYRKLAGVSFALYTSMAWHLITSLDELVDRYHRPSIELNAQEDRSDQSLGILARMQNERRHDLVRVRSVSCNPGRIMHHALRFSIPDPEKVTAIVPAVDKCSAGRRKY